MASPESVSMATRHLKLIYNVYLVLSGTFLHQTFTTKQDQEEESVLICLYGKQDIDMFPTLLYTVYPGQTGGVTYN